VAPILLGYVLGPMIEENFRRALLLSRGDLATFVERPISAVFIALCVLLLAAQLYAWLRAIWRKSGRGKLTPDPTADQSVAAAEPLRLGD